MYESYTPELITLGIFSEAIAAAIVISFFASLFFAAIESRFKKYLKSFSRIFFPLASYSMPIALVAYVAGLLTTASRTTAVTNVVPAVLALIGGLNIYVFGSDNKNKVLIAYCVSLFAIMILYGAEFGAYRREADRVSRFEELTRQELKIRQLRKVLDLPDDVPEWLTSSEPK